MPNWRPGTRPFFFVEFARSTTRSASTISPRFPRGSVVWQEPAPYSEIGSGSSVELIVSSGAPALVIPEVDGMEAALAPRILTAGGLKVSRVDSVANSAPKGTALATRPAAGVTRAADRFGLPASVSVSENNPVAPTSVLLRRLAPLITR